MEIGKMLGTVQAVGGPKREDKALVEGARQFEAMLLQEMLKPLQFGAGPDEGGEESAGGAADTVRGFGTEAIASGGGFGIARQIVRQVGAEEERRG